MFSETHGFSRGSIKNISYTHILARKRAITSTKTKRTPGYPILNIEKVNI